MRGLSVAATGIILAVIGAVSVLLLIRYAGGLVAPRPEPGRLLVDAVLCGRELVVKNRAQTGLRVVVYAAPLTTFVNPDYGVSVGDMEPIATLDMGPGEVSSLTIPSTYSVRVVALSVRTGSGSVMVQVVNSCS